MVDGTDALGEGQARVYYAWVQDAGDPAETERRRRLLSEDERTRHLRFYFEHDRQTYLAAHALTRTVLGKLVDAPPASLRFELGEHGRPELSFPAQRPALRFNLSHTRGLVACAVAIEADVGVDVEQVERRLDIEQLARSVFSESERNAMAALPVEAQRTRFFELWTLKESYIKAVGKGLALPLRAITLQLDAQPTPRIEFGPQIADDGRQWWFEVQQPRASHMLSVALRSASKPRFSVYELSDL
jgi:4'-phosphopantetheinyl transferase